jgi:aryl-alcohol dehydrogenase-like predicted oxidoreductase
MDVLADHGHFRVADTDDAGHVSNRDLSLLEHGALLDVDFDVFADRGRRRLRSRVADPGQFLRDRAIAKITANVKALQKEGLILFAAADTFSGQETYKAMMASSAFATLNINFNVADDYPEREIFPFARKQNMRVVVREAFIKGVLFRLAKEAGIGDDGLIASAGMKWLASRPGIDSVIMGPDTAEHLRDNLRAFHNTKLDDAENAALEKLRAHPSFVALKKQKDEEFSAGTAIGQRAAL